MGAIRQSGPEAQAETHAEEAVQPPSSSGPAPHAEARADAHAPAPVEAAAQPTSTWRFQLLADREAKWTESRYWKEFAIGHAWIRLIAPGGAADSWGYWPDLEGGHAVDPSAPWKSVPGRVRHPDTAHSPNAIQTHDVTADAADRVTQAANAKEASPGNYNLFSYNCTTFAAEMARVAGVPVPSFATLGIANPNALFAGIEASNKSRGLDAAENPLPPDGGAKQ